jgi:hypothetical protein
MNFGQAIEALKAGKQVSRSGWNGKGMWLVLINNATFNDVYNGVLFRHDPFIAMKTAGESLVPWLASQTDMLAEDWGVVEP